MQGEAAGVAKAHKHLSRRQWAVQRGCIKILSDTVKSAKATSEPLCEGHRTLFTPGCYHLALYLISSASPANAKPSY